MYYDSFHNNITPFHEKYIRIAVEAFHRVYDQREKKSANRPEIFFDERKDIDKQGGITIFIFYVKNSYRFVKFIDYVNCGIFASEYAEQFITTFTVRPTHRSILEKRHEMVQLFEKAEQKERQWKQQQDTKKRNLENGNTVD